MLCALNLLKNLAINKFMFNFVFFFYIIDFSLDIRIKNCYHNLRSWYFRFGVGQSNEPNKDFRQILSFKDQICFIVLPPGS